MSITDTQSPHTPHTHTHIHTLTHTRTHTHTLTHTHSHTHTLTLTHTHTHTHTQNRLVSLKESEEQGTQLEKDQLDAIAKIENVTIQLELVKELQKQFQALSVEVSMTIHL